MLTFYFGITVFGLRYGSCLNLWYADYFLQLGSPHGMQRILPFKSLRCSLIVAFAPSCLVFLSFKSIPIGKTRLTLSLFLLESINSN